MFRNTETEEELVGHYDLAARKSALYCDKERCRERLVYAAGVRAVDDIEGRLERRRLVRA